MLPTEKASSAENALVLQDMADQEFGDLSS